MSLTRRRAFSTRATGFLLAGGVLLVGGGVIGFFALRSPTTTGPAHDQRPKNNITMPPAPVDVTEAGLANAGRARFQFVDRLDPSRVVGRLEWRSLDPLPNGRAAVDQPRAVIYLDGGRRALVRAEKGMVFMPSREQPPESGSFDGAVTVSLVEGDPAGDGPDFDPPDDRVLARLVTPTLRFDTALGEAMLPGGIRASGRGFELAARGLRVVGDQINRRIALLELDATDWLTISPEQAREDAAAVRSTPGQASPPAPRTGPERRDDYRVQIANALRVARRDGHLRAGGLDLLTRLVDNRFADDAFGPPSRRPASTTAASGSAPATPKSATSSLAATLLAEATARAAPAPAGYRSLYKPSSDQIVAVWEGALRLRPAEGPTPALDRDAVFATLLGAESDDGSPRVAVDDPELQASGRAATVTYGSTTRTITLNAREGDDADRVIIQQANRGALLGQSITFGLDSGVGQARGRGSLIGSIPADPNEAPPRLDWTEQADFELLRRDGALVGLPASAAFTGDVAATSDEGRLMAGRIEARFTTDPTDPNQARLARVTATELARVTAAEVGPAQPGELNADQLIIDFDPSTSNTQPTLVTASGQVRGTRDGWTLTAGLLEATLEADSRGKPVVRTVQARDGVTIRDQDTTLIASSLRAEVPEQRLELIADETPAATPVSILRDGVTITGPRALLDGSARRLTIPGAGTFAYERPAAADRSAPRVDASWTRSMVIDDAMGRADLLGDAVAMSNPSPDELDTVKADRITLEFTPRPTEPLQSTPAPAASGERGFLRASAESGPEPTAAPVRVESQRFLVGGSPRTLERLLYLESRRVSIDEVAGRLDVPEPGKLLVDDRRAPTAAEQSVASPLALGSARGSSLFSWTGQFTFDRRAGELAFTSAPDDPITGPVGVRLLHRAAPGEPVTALDARSLNAKLLLPNVGGQAANIEAGAQLLSTQARGDVSVSFQGQRLQAERLDYDARANRAEAAADSAEGRVLLADPTKPQPITARKLIWDLKDNRVTIVEPAPIVIPR